MLVAGGGAPSGVSGLAEGVSCGLSVAYGVLTSTKRIVCVVSWLVVSSEIGNSIVYFL